MPYTDKECIVCNKIKRMYSTAKVCNDCRPDYIRKRSNAYTKEYQKKRRQVDEEYRKDVNKQSSNSKSKRYAESSEIRQAELNKKYKRRAVMQVIPLSEKDWQSICEKFNNKCAYCDNPWGLTVDHIIPLSKGGTNALNNIVPACTSCNSSKHTKDMLEWYQSQLFFSDKKLKLILEVIDNA